MYYSFLARIEEIAVGLVINQVYIISTANSLLENGLSVARYFMPLQLGRNFSDGF
jgi:hypothetical protein